MVTATGNYSITAAGGSNHIVVSDGANVTTQGWTVTLTGTPAFAVGFVQVYICGTVNAGIMTFSGAATGPRFYMGSNGVINTNGGGVASYFPGNSAGVDAGTGGRYV